MFGHARTHTHHPFFFLYACVYVVEISPLTPDVLLSCRFEYAFIIPATSPPFERTKHARLRYILTATAIGAGRGKGNVSTWQEIFVVLQVAADGGPTALDVQYHDVHETLGPLSVSLTSSSLTVGGTAALHVYHPDPPPGVSVHVIRVFLEQTVELYSSVRRAWLKLPMEKLRLWEKGCMPYKARHPEHVSEKDTIWFARTDPATGQATRGVPGRGAGDGRPSLAPFGEPLVGTFSQHAAPGPARVPPGRSEGYALKAIMRLPEHRILRPSTVRGSKTDIRVTHEIGVEVFFSRLSVLDQRPGSESFGKPKVQVFSMRRAAAIPSCAFTYDAIHLPPYSLESPLPSRPGSPSPSGLAFSTRSAPGTPGPSSLGGPGLGGRSYLGQAELEAWKATTSLAHSLPSLTHPFATSRSSPAGSQGPSRAPSRATSPEPSPDREERPSRSHHRGSIGSGLAAALGRRSRHSSPERPEQSPDLSATRPGLSRRGSSISLYRPRGLHAFTPSHPISRAPSPPAPMPTTTPPSGSASTNATAGSENGNRNGISHPSSPVWRPASTTSMVAPSTPSGVPITTFGGYFPPTASGASTPTRATSPALGPQRPGLGSRSSSFTHRSLGNLSLSSASAPTSGGMGASQAGPGPGGPSGSAGAGAAGGAGSFAPGLAGGLSGLSSSSTAPGVPPWSSLGAYGNGTGESKTSHALCNCSRSTEELAEAEQRLLEGVPTAPGAWVDLHDPGSEPPPWMPPRSDGEDGWALDRAGGESSDKVDQARARGKAAELG